MTQEEMELLYLRERERTRSPTSLPVRTKRSSLGAGVPWPARDTSFSSNSEALPY